MYDVYPLPTKDHANYNLDKLSFTSSTCTATRKVWPSALDTMSLPEIRVSDFNKVCKVQHENGNWMTKRTPYALLAAFY